MELSKFRDVEDIVFRIQEFRKKNQNREKYQDLLLDLDEYCGKLEDVLSYEGEGGEGELSLDLDVGDTSQSTMFLEYLS